jgi:hypothetical protein
MKIIALGSTFGWPGSYANAKVRLNLRAVRKIKH